MNKSDYLGFRSGSQGKVGNGRKSKGEHNSKVAKLNAFSPPVKLGFHAPVGGPAVSPEAFIGLIPICWGEGGGGCLRRSSSFALVDDGPKLS